MSVSPGAVPSPNIWHHTATYELENRAVDPDGHLESAMTMLLARPRPEGGKADIDAWAGRAVLDLGCGTGFHLPRFAALTGPAGSVTGVEPHGALVRLARRRTRALANVAVHQGAAQDLPLPDASVDVAHVRWAYFFGPGCEPGLAELDRVVRRGGTAFVIDNDADRSTFGGWFRRGYPSVEPGAVERFWSTHGWTRTPVDIRWSFTSRADLESVVRIEFDREVADAVLAGHTGTEVDYAVNLWSKRF